MLCVVCVCRELGVVREERRRVGMMSDEMTAARFEIEASILRL